MRESLNSSIIVDPIITGSYQDSGDASLEVLNDLFIPLIILDTTYNMEKCTYLGNVDEETLPLINFDEEEAVVETVKFTVKTKIKLKVEQGNKNANIEEDSIMISSKQVKMVNAIHNGKTITCDDSSLVFLDEVKYGDTFEIEIEPYELQENSYNDAYILFQYYEVATVADCGKVRFTNTSKVGKRLVTNIEGLPTAPSLYAMPPLWTDPQKSFDVANKYKNCGGMCYAVTMSRVNKAYNDIGKSEPLDISNVKNMDYYISGTTAPSIPNNYLGYGVGGAISKNSKALLLTEDDIKEGKLEEGAILQYWNNKDKLSWDQMKTEIKKYTQNLPTKGYYGGHSIIFKSYQYDETGNITGLKYYDYEGTNRTVMTLKDNVFYRGSNPIIVIGVNLID